MTQIIQLRDDSFVPGLTSNLLSLRTMVADRFDFNGKRKYITLCSRWLRFPVRDMYSLYGFPITKKMFRTMPYIWDAPRHYVKDAKNVWVRDDTAKSRSPPIDGHGKI